MRLRLLITVVLLLGAAGAAAAFVLLREPPGAAAGSLGAPGSAPVEASARALRAAAAGSRAAPTFWAGSRPGTRLEVTRTTDGRHYVRYLTGVARAGDRRPAFLTVATYPQRDALAVTRRSARRPGMVAERLASGGLLVLNRRRPLSAYVAYPGLDRLVEVYAPRADEARRLIEAGAVGPVL